MAAMGEGGPRTLAGEVAGKEEEEEDPARDSPGWISGRLAAVSLRRPPPATRPERRTARHMRDADLACPARSPTPLAPYGSYGKRD